MAMNSEETFRNDEIFQRIIFVKCGVLAFSENLPLLKNTIFLPPRILRLYGQLNHDTFKPVRLCGTHGWAGSWNSPSHSLVEPIFEVLWTPGTCFPISYLLAGMQSAFTYFWLLNLFLNSYFIPDFFTATTSQVQNKSAQRHTDNKVNSAFLWENKEIQALEPY